MLDKPENLLKRLFGKSKYEAAESRTNSAGFGELCFIVVQVRLLRSRARFRYLGIIVTIASHDRGVKSVRFN